VSRLTFRSKAGAVCWQKQLRDRYLNEGIPPVPHLDVKRAEVRRVSRHLAEQVILKYEWLGTMAQTGYHYGLFFGSYCAGVCCVAAGAATGGVNSHRPFGVLPGEFAVLARGACTHWAPSGSNSKLVSWTCRLFAKDAHCRVLIAYSDTDAGEVGTIYQACSWVYIGKGAATRQWVAPNGRIYDQKLPYDLKRKRGGTRAEFVQALRVAGWSEQASNPKHRYVNILDKSDTALVARVAQMRRPYPKRAASIDSDAPALQAGDGSANLTAALQDDPDVSE
jgi:hypothetical protein